MSASPDVTRADHYANDVVRLRLTASYGAYGAYGGYEFMMNPNHL